jgi:pyruvate carboxylase
VYRHEIPGGQLSNLRQQAIALGLGEKFEQIEDLYAAANDILGNIVKVTPSSKVVGDLALSLVATDADPAAFADDPGSFDVPDSVIGFLSGELGDPPGGWPEPFRTKALAGRTVKHREEKLDPEDAAALETDRRSTLNRLLFPGPTKDFADSRERYSDLSVLPTRDYLYGLDAEVEHDVYLDEGVRLILGVESVSPPDERGIRTVMCTINGQLRPVSVRDRSVSSDAPAQERADTGVAGQIGAPFDGVVSVVVEVGATVEAGQTVATIEAMKMEAAITTPVAGTVDRVALDGPRSVEGGDLVVVVRSG